ncbi:hypothetical protein WMY93_000060 [Mugilogobius chulae]|uniref:Uncharacterized protein n=1 Tax=Mugilogobius chulae TaxID=88201 RepID=A0AAW0Q129_9GOBI
MKRDVVTHRRNVRPSDAAANRTQPAPRSGPQKVPGPSQEPKEVNVSRSRPTRTDRDNGTELQDRQDNGTELQDRERRRGLHLSSSPAPSEMLLRSGRSCKPLAAANVRNDGGSRLFQRLKNEAAAVKLQEKISYSPDMSPIKHVCNALDRCISQRGPVPVNFQQLNMAIEEEWTNIPQATIHSFFKPYR